MQKKLIFTALAIGVIAVFAFFMYLKIYGDPYEYTEMERSVTQYLVEEQGYSPDDIQQIHIEHVPMKRPGYYAEVVFKDEPQTTYLYCPEGTEEQRIVPCGEKEAAATNP